MRARFCCHLFLHWRRNTHGIFFFLDLDSRSLGCWAIDGAPLIALNWRHLTSLIRFQQLERQDAMVQKVDGEAMVFRLEGGGAILWWRDGVHHMGLTLFRTEI